jgi:hypothetical protein
MQHGKREAPSPLFHLDLVVLARGLELVLVGLVCGLDLGKRVCDRRVSIQKSRPPTPAAAVKKATKVVLTDEMNTAVSCCIRNAGQMLVMACEVEGRGHAHEGRGESQNRGWYRFQPSSSTACEWDGMSRKTMLWQDWWIKSASRCAAAGRGAPARRSACEARWRPTFWPTVACPRGASRPS